MNEYQDQTLWWEVQILAGGCWLFLSDHDSREDAQEWKTSYSEVYPKNVFRVKRVTGLDA